MTTTDSLTTSVHPSVSHQPCMEPKPVGLTEESPADPKHPADFRPAQLLMPTHRTLAVKEVTAIFRATSALARVEDSVFSATVARVISVFRFACTNVSATLAREISEFALMFIVPSVLARVDASAVSATVRN